LGGLPISSQMGPLFQVIVDWLNQSKGVLCFSQDWHNAMLRSHYGDKHNGMCIGFRLGPKAVTNRPRYVRTRRKFDADMSILLKGAARFPAIKRSRKLPPNCEKAVERLLLTKFEA
jgi:hypothetical protein